MTATNLEAGTWYLLVLDEHDDEAVNLAHAPIAEYIGDGDFVDDDGASFSAGQFDRFIKQS